MGHPESPIWTAFSGLSASFEGLLAALSNVSRCTIALSDSRGGNCGKPSSFARMARELAARPPGVKHRVHLCVRTGGISVYQGILLRRQHAFDPPFVREIIVDLAQAGGTVRDLFLERFGAPPADFRE